MRNVARTVYFDIRAAAAAIEIHALELSLTAFPAWKKRCPRRPGDNGEPEIAKI